MRWKWVFAILPIILIAGCTVDRPDDDLTVFCRAHNIKEVTSVPDGVTPISFKSVKEFKDFVLALETTAKAQPFQTEELITEIKALYGIKRVVRITSRKNFGIGGYVELVGDVEISNYGVPGDQYISNCWEWTWMGGITLGFDWKQAYAYHRITNATIFDVYGGGTLDGYLLINGLIKIMSWNISLQAHKEVY